MRRALGVETLRRWSVRKDCRCRATRADPGCRECGYRGTVQVKVVRWVHHGRTLAKTESCPECGAVLVRRHRKLMVQEVQ